jgi:hypothetical protein
LELVPNRKKETILAIFFKIRNTWIHYHNKWLSFLPLGCKTIWLRTQGCKS